MAQHARREIRLSAVRIDELAVLALGHGVDGEIAPLQILLQAHLGRGLRREAAIAGRNLALAPRERVLLVRLRMQEHRELAPHRLVTGALQLLRLSPDHHPVALADRNSQQPVPYRAADQVDSHGAHVNREPPARRGESRRTCCVRRARVAAGGGLCAAVRLRHLVSHAGRERRVAGTAPACAHRYAAGRPAHAAGAARASGGGARRA